MNDDTKSRLYGLLNSLRNNSVSIAAVILAILVMTVPVVAQQAINASDDFEDQSFEGWEGANLNVVQEGAETGNYSLSQTDGYPDKSEYAKWNSPGPIDLSQQFTIKGTTRTSIGQYQTRVGLINDNDAGAMLVFSKRDNAVVLAEDGVDYSSADDPSISEGSGGYYENTWVRWEITSPEGQNSLEATVWEYGTEKPDTPQMTREFDPVNAPFGMQAGPVGANRVIQLDQVSISGERAQDDSLILETGNFMVHGTTQDFTVYQETPSPNTASRNLTDVTDNATVTSGNTDILRINDTANQLIVESTTNESRNDRVNITAEYEGGYAYTQVTVATPTVDNLELLPFFWRVNAMFSDRAFQMVLVGVLLSVAATRTASAFAGLGVYQMVLTAGWLIGWVPIGLALVGLFSTLFIGLNMAANINYTSMN